MSNKDFDALIKKLHELNQDIGQGVTMRAVNASPSSEQVG